MLRYYLVDINTINRPHIHECNAYVNMHTELHSYTLSCGLLVDSLSKIWVFNKLAKQYFRQNCDRSVTFCRKAIEFYASTFADVKPAKFGDELSLTVLILYDSAVFVALGFYGTF